MPRIKTYQGLLCVHANGEHYDALYLSSEPYTLPRVLSWIQSKPITVRYWISDTQLTKEQAQEKTIHMLCGKGGADYYHYYSELTGYLWTTENLKVGGHDLLAELRSHVGRWLILEIEYKGSGPKD